MMKDGGFIVAKAGKPLATLIIHSDNQKPGAGEGNRTLLASLEG